MNHIRNFAKNYESFALEFLSIKVRVKLRTFISHQVNEEPWLDVQLLNSIVDAAGQQTGRNPLYYRDWGTIPDRRRRSPRSVNRVAIMMRY